MSMTKRFRNAMRLFFTGFMMGAADLVPGVSGGTIAFIAGIYEELIYSIKYVSGEAIRMVFKKGIVPAIKSIPYTFLVPLFAGLFSAVLFLSEGLSYLLEAHPTYLWSFFFGLIVASAWIVRKRIVTWNVKDVVVLLVACAISFYVVGAVPVATAATPFAFFLTGAVAIMAMILPGISGSFILVILGKYDQILSAVVEREFMILVFVGIGAVVGLAIFSRVVSWLFAHYHDVVVATLTGLMIGSLRKIWPWKMGIDGANVLPDQLSLEVMLSLALAILGFYVVYRLDMLHITDEHTEDIADKSFQKTHKASLKKEK